MIGRRRGFVLSLALLAPFFLSAAARAQVRYMLPGSGGALTGPIYGQSGYGGGYPVYPPGLITNGAINNPYYYRGTVPPLLYSLGGPTGLPVGGTTNFYRPLQGMEGYTPGASPLYYPGTSNPQRVPAELYAIPAEGVTASLFPLVRTVPAAPRADSEEPGRAALLELFQREQARAWARAVKPAPRKTAKEAEGPAHLEVLLPTADAQVWFQGQKTKRTGKVREFRSPPLTPGSDYNYEIRARWVSGDRPVTQTRTVPVRAGQRVRVDFTAKGP